MIVKEPSELKSGRKFDNSFGVYFRILKIQDEPDIMPRLKIKAISELLFGEGASPDPEGIKEYFGLLRGTDPKPASGEPALDLLQDADYVFAGFMQCYRIDLNLERISVFKFNALLKGLTGTRLNEIMDLRLRPLPKPDKYNAEYRQSLMTAKQSVALKRKGQDAGWKQKFLTAAKACSSRNLFNGRT